MKVIMLSIGVFCFIIIGSIHYRPAYAVNQLAVDSKCIWDTYNECDDKYNSPPDGSWPNSSCLKYAKNTCGADY